MEAWIETQADQLPGLVVRFAWQVGTREWSLGTQSLTRDAGCPKIGPTGSSNPVRQS
jgi:hypothetical protein